MKTLIRNLPEGLEISIYDDEKEAEILELYKDDEIYITSENRPSKYHIFDWETKTWVEDETLKPSYKELRSKEYPPMSEYLDGIVKDDNAQVQKYITDCLSVKAKYPKPSE